MRRISGIYAAAVTIRAYYEGGFDEDGRLTEGSVEWVRSKELVGRVLPQPPARVADVAGGTGVYAVWLAELGHEVSLLDLVPSHVARARERAGAAGVVVDCVEGDARALPWPDDTFDVVMVMGALYHLPDQADRLACLREALRVLRPAGALVASYICRWASLFDGYRSGYVADDRFVAILGEDLSSGRHDNPSGHPMWFTTFLFPHAGGDSRRAGSSWFPGHPGVTRRGFHVRNRRAAGASKRRWDGDGFGSPASPRNRARPDRRLLAPHIAVPKSRFACHLKRAHLPPAACPGFAMPRSQRSTGTAEPKPAGTQRRSCRGVRGSPQAGAPEHDRPPLPLVGLA